jgi:TorA maturation chaperone TorD
MPATPAVTSASNDEPAAQAVETGSAAGPGSAPVIAAADLLAHWWSRPVAAEVSTWLGAAETEADLPGRLSGDPGTRGGGLAYSSGQVPALLDEYERLFVGPGQVPCPPYESFWRDDVPIDLWHSLMGPCTAGLRRLYREIGIDMAQDAGELPDHIAVEFEALAYALSSADSDRVARALVSDHLSQWLPRLCRAVASEAGHPFYAGLAAVTLDWLGHIERYVEPAAAVKSGTP